MASIIINEQAKSTFPQRPLRPANAQEDLRCQHADAKGDQKNEEAQHLFEGIHRFVIFYSG